MPHAQTENYSTPSEYFEWLKHHLIIKQIGDYQHISTRKREQLLKIGFEYEFSGDNTTQTPDAMGRYIVQLWQSIGINVQNTYDGSLSDYGREMKFPPMTESAYRALEFVFTQMFQTMMRTGFSDTQNRTGGHLHISIKSFGNELAQRRVNIGRFVQWFYVNREDIQKFALRRGTQWAEFREWNDDYQAMSSYSARYRAVNLLTGPGHSLRGAKTVEVRIFAGVRTVNQLLANVQLLKIIVNSLNGYNAKVLENYDLNALILENRRNAPECFAHWMAVNVGR